MTAAALLAELARRGVHVWADGDQLRYRAPRGALTPELLDAMQTHKAELLRTVRERKQAAGDTKDSDPKAPIEQAYSVLVDGRVVFEAHTKAEAVIAFDKTIRDIGPTENQVVVELVDGEGKKWRVGYLPPWRGNRAVAP